MNTQESNESFGNQLSEGAVQTAITGLIMLVGEDHVFQRIVAELERVHEKYPEHDGDSLKHKVIEDTKIIFDDLIVPLGKFELNFLIEVGLLYLRGKLK